MRRLVTPTKIALITFCTRFHFYIHIYALYLQAQGLTLLQISTIESLVIAVQFAADVPTGIIADRIGRRWSVTSSVLLLMCGELLFLVSVSYAQYLLVAVFTGLGFAFASGAMEALVYDSLPVESRAETMQRVMGTIGGIGQFAFFLSPLIGGIIVGDLSPARVHVAIALTAAALFIGILISLTLREPESTAHQQRASTLVILRNGFAAVRDNRRLRRFILLTVLTASFGGTLITTFAPPYLAHNAVSPYAIGLALSIGSLCAMLTQQAAYRVEQALGPDRGFMLLTLLPGALYLLSVLIAGPLPAWLIVVTLYAFNDMRSPLVSAHQNAMLDSGSRATVLSLSHTALSFFLAVMAPLYAALAERSLTLAFAAMGAFIVLAAMALRPRPGFSIASGVGDV